MKYFCQFRVYIMLKLDPLLKAQNLPLLLFIVQEWVNQIQI